MKALFAALSLTLFVNFSAHADSVCQDLQKIETKLLAKLNEINDEINKAETSNQADAHINKYEKVYRQYQDVRSEYLDLCVN